MTLTVSKISTRKKWGILLLVLLIVFFVGIKLYSAERNNNFKSVEIIHVKRGDMVDYVRARGHIESTQTIIMRVPENGRIKKIFIRDGERVNYGQELLRFDTTEAENQLRKFRLALEQSEISFQEARGKIESQMKEKEENFQKVLIEKEKAEREVKIADELYKVQAESLLNLKSKEDRLRQVEIDFLKAKREKEEVRQFYWDKENASVNNFSSLWNEYENARAKMESAKVDLEMAMAKLERFKIISPLKGTILKLEVRESMNVSTGEPLMTIADTERLHIVAEVDELDAGRIKINQDALITFEAFPEKQFKSHVKFISKNAVRKDERIVVEVIIMINEPTDILKIGNTVDIKIISERKNDILSLPLNSIHQNENGSYFVWLYKNGMAREREINIGLSDLNLVEILDGLQDGEQVILSSDIDLKDGERIEIK